MMRRPPRSTLDRSSAASDVYKRQVPDARQQPAGCRTEELRRYRLGEDEREEQAAFHRESVVSAQEVLAVGHVGLSLIHISEPTRPY